LHQVGTSSLLIYMMHGHTYIKGLYYDARSEKHQIIDVVF